MKTILLGLFLLSFNALFAQYDEDEKPFHFGIGPALSIPLADLKSVTTYGVGIEVQPSYALSEKIEAFFQTGVHVFQASSSYGSDNSSVLHIPILIGARFKAAGFFAGAGVGYGIFMSGGESSNGFMYSPQIGYDFAGKYEVGANYTSAKVTGGTLSYIGIKAFRKF